jgi:predicted translin family RNA/ssDNA-binding protein
VVKYITRWKLKGQPLSDLEKAKHCIDLLIEIHKRQMKITIEVDGTDAEEIMAMLQRASEAVEKLEAILEEFEDADKV